jgi:hypothetical protein
MEQLIITPKTKVFDLLETYPELEDTLIRLAPPFKKLRNPMLRKTVAKITNLSQAATIGGLNVEELINQLRHQVGQDRMENLEAGSKKYVTLKPDWFVESGVANTINISDMLNKGEQPVHEVLSAIKKLEKGEILKIQASFIPAPLIDKAASLGYLEWIEQKSDSDINVYFTKGS